MNNNHWNYPGDNLMMENNVTSYEINPKKKPYKIIMFICVILLVGICGYYAYEYFSPNDKPEEIIKVGKIYEDRDLVFERDEKVYLDDCERDGTEKSVLPFININSEEVKKYNEELLARFSKIIDEITYFDASHFEDDYRGQKCYKEWGMFEFDYHVNENILSLVLKVTKVKWHIGDYSYEVKNFDINTGKEIVEEDILRIKDLTKIEFTGKIKSGVTEFYSRIPNWCAPDDYECNPDKLMQKDIKDTMENVDYDNLNMFINENNNIAIVIRTYFSEGHDAWYYNIVEVK